MLDAIFVARCGFYLCFLMLLCCINVVFSHSVHSCIGWHRNTCGKLNTQTDTCWIWQRVNSGDYQVYWHADTRRQGHRQTYRHKTHAHTHTGRHLKWLSSVKCTLTINYEQSCKLWHAIVISHRTCIGVKTTLYTKTSTLFLLSLAHYLYKLAIHII